MHISAEKSIEFLRAYSSFNHEQTLPKIKFIFENPESNNLILLRKAIGIEKQNNAESEVQLILRLLKWAIEHFDFPGSTLIDRRYDDTDWFEVIERAKREKFSLNCRYKSLLFTQILLAYGIKARWVSCLPVESITHERHCVTEVYVNRLNKWIVVDCAFNLIYFDSDGTMLSLIEMRERLINGNRIRFFIKEQKYAKYVYDCWMSHIFRFKYAVYNGYNMLSSTKRIYAYLNPDSSNCDKNKIIDAVGCEEGEQFYDERCFY